MSDPTPESTPAPAAGPRDTTFRSFTKEQGKNYAQHRHTYHPALYQIILDHHKSTGGQFDSILDVGCGPGMAVRDLALLFVHAIGIDPSAGMITTARSLGGVSSSNDPIRFEISSAEDLGTDLNPPVQSNTVDLIVAATAAHWFDMPKFWHRAAQVLKPGGTVAIWCSSNAKPKSSTPNFTAVQAAFDLVQDRLDPYMKPGNLLARDMYIGMPLPWDLEVPVFEFDESTYVRKEWNNDGSGEPLDFYADMRPADMDTLEKLFGTMSPVARWREAHPEAVGTEEDIVRMMRREVEAALHEAGTEKGKELIEATVGGVLMMAKKKLSSSN